MWLVILFSSTALGLIKLTIFLFQYHLFWPLRWFRCCVYLGAPISTVFYGAIAIAQIVLATPSRGETWIDHWVSPRESTSKLLDKPIGVGGLAIDLYLLILPLIAVYQRQMPRKQKYKLLLIFSFGLL